MSRPDPWARWETMIPGTPLRRKVVEIRHIGSVPCFPVESYEHVTFVRCDGTNVHVQKQDGTDEMVQPQVLEL